MHLENQFFSILKENFTQSEILPNQKIQGGNEVFDIIINNKNNRGQLAFDIKYFGSNGSRNLLYSACVRLAHATDRLNISQAIMDTPGKKREAKVAGILVLIYSDSTTSFNIIKKNLEIINSVLKRKLGILILPEQSLSDPEIPEIIFDLWSGKKEISSIGL